MTDKAREISEPLPQKAGDDRVLVNGRPLTVDFRVVAEEKYVQLKSTIESQRLALEEKESSVLENNHTIESQAVVIGQLQARVRELEDGLVKYGQHGYNKHTCATLKPGDYECDCGFDNLITPPAEKN